jgi:hypothetical protein
MKNEFEIELKGSGTKQEIIQALYNLIESIEEQNENNMESLTFEDATLCTEIKEL